MTTVKSRGNILMNIVGTYLLIAALLVLGGSMVQADVIYYDDFSGDEGLTLNGKAPDIRPNTEVWGGTIVYEYDGEGGVYNSTGIGRANHLPLTIGENLKYTLTARIVNPETEDNWIAIGWTTDSYAAFGDSSTDSSYWMLWRGSDDLVAFEGPATQEGVTGSSSPAGESNVLDVRIILDQLAETPTAYFQYKNPGVSVWSDHGSTELTQTRLDAITKVGFSGTGTGGLQSFKLEAIPEPSSIGLILLGLAAAARLRLRGRRGF